MVRTQTTIWTPQLNYVRIFYRDKSDVRPEGSKEWQESFNVTCAMSMGVPLQLLI